MAPKKHITAPAARSKPVKGPHKVEKPWTFKKYRNGLLNLKAPARYMSITKTNSITSPLLALPAEIRNKIFGYVMGGYDIYIMASNQTSEFKTITFNDGSKHARHVFEKNRILTTILPKDTEYRSAEDGDQLPNLCLPRVCRQLYMETALLPYVLNHFKFVGYLTKTTGGKYSTRGGYSTMDVWSQLRKPAQLQAITSIAPTLYYLHNYLLGDRPGFRKRFPALKHVDLRLSSMISPASSAEKWGKAAKSGDLDGSIAYTFADPRSPKVWNTIHRLEKGMGDGPNHFETVVDAGSD
ncbi:hypothetical protein CC86DRAFT_463452 [Ophiobolus disseminans]|uniref:DUF7730 domain-containing protein n=1 Tax=Ophiobolus disseminans TaxID=1469910 RepID=A0A6A7AG83_9PLEO|nr:hypothetical protein CC86DRAFT_463452 [Ophiobolus disseminans]